MMRKIDFISAKKASVLLFAFAMCTDAGALPQYSAGIPGPPVIRNTANGLGNAWLSSNSVLPVMSIADTSALIISNTPGIRISRETIPDNPKVTLTSVESGFTFERAKPQYWLSERIVPPADIDWTRTYTTFTNSGNANFLFDPNQPAVYTVRGGSLAFTWCKNDGTDTEIVYTISPVAPGRPRRIFWTDWPFNGPPVNASGKFVKFFGDPELLTLQYGSVTNTAAGLTTVVTNKITSGLYVDESTKLIYAAGQLSGQVVMAYYDSGSYDVLTYVQVVEIARPSVIPMTGKIGTALRPNGNGHPTDGLIAKPTIIAENDDRGPYVYQHKGNNSYSPKSGNVYPLRRTVGERWNNEIYWMETDAMEVQWPFELCQYECDWPEDCVTFVRGCETGSDGKTDYGRPIFFPETYTAELMDFQEPEGHAKSVEGDGSFISTGEGHSLIKLTANDNIWFLPVHSILRTNTNYFTLKPEILEVGFEAELRGGSIDGTSDGYTPDADPLIPGYIYKPVSGDNYNPDIYSEPVADSGIDGANISTNVSETISSGSTNNYPSVVYLVTTNSKPLEVWWSSKVISEDMPEEIQVPSLPQVYTGVWPQKTQVPQIVLASQLGSANISVYQQGQSLVFDSTESEMILADRAYFSAGEGSVMMWVKPGTSVVESAILTLGDNQESAARLEVALETSGNIRLSVHDMISGVTNSASAAPSPGGDSGSWSCVAVTFKDENARLFIDGNFSQMISSPAVTGLVDTIRGNRIGAAPGKMISPPDWEIDEVSFWCESLSEDEINELKYRQFTGKEAGLTAYYSFNGNDDLVPVSGSDYRIAHDVVLGTVHYCHSVLACTPGAPAKKSGIIEADETPTLYVQNDSSKPAFNPNEEHALIRSGSGGYVAWALRCDLNEPQSSIPAVLVEYVSGGKQKMAYYSVVATNEVYPAFSANCTAGTILRGPHPLDFFDNPWLDEIYWRGDAKTSPGFRDRKKQVWARCAGTLPIYMYYEMQDGFFFPTLTLKNQPDIGTPIPWMSRFSNENADPINSKPVEWTWNVSWPESLPEMKIGQTLTTASEGLPEVWNAKSVGILYPANPDDNTTVILSDPTAAQTAGDSGSASVAVLMQTLGLDSGPEGELMLRNGKYYFKDLPPSVSSRLYLDPNAPVGSCIKFIGEKEDNPGGVSLLHINVLAKDERDAILSYTSNMTVNASARWNKMITGLAEKPLVPNKSSYAYRITASGADSVTNSLVIEYSPVDHYALTAMGMTNYVTLIENDSTNTLMGIDEGDPISMKIIRIVPEYYTGRVVTREDPVNLLSQQLSVIYSESFAGSAGKYEFEWRKASPSANGKVPDDFDSGYTPKFPPSETLGKTKFVIGGQGDTLANMVNTYYTVRYRAATNSAAYPVMGAAWSDWITPPALAEGWVQRVLNNITPFTQRMQDLYENEAETAVTMIRQAGPPYEGDVALNQDNLTSVGLIQLYQTILNKAESMSILLGINDADANKQLLLAVERLADLYTVLGDEAYTDAMNPTIGFGGNYGEVENSLAIDYGAASSSLFCFDNQLPSLLEEELALLRGRTGENAPVTTLSPYYNRLVWNFTKGITAGEVAYAVNYDISGTSSATIDYQQAAEAYPQGHGDAYGHYLSALAGYYRLLRNPYFSWGTVGMGEMVVADAVINVDYYDEAKFAQAAANMAKTSVDIIDRTARKSWRDNNGAPGAGYLDEDDKRNFGYGEWASRGGYGALCNWIVANSLLPEQESSGVYHQLVFNGTDGKASGTVEDTYGYALSSNGAPWTVEFQTVPSSAGQLSENARLVDLEDDSGRLSFILSNGSDLHLAKYSVTQAFETNVISETYTGIITNSDLEVITETREAVWTNIVPYKVYTETERVPAGTLPAGASSLVALTCASDAYPHVMIISADGNLLAETPIGWHPEIEPSSVSTGDGFSGVIGELRLWKTYRDAELLHSKRGYTDPRTTGLAAYLRTISKSDEVIELADETSGLPWTLSNPEWAEQKESGLGISFEDEGLLRIDRSTVGELETIANSVPEIQKKTDSLDIGLNPLGLSSSAIPFDITPIGIDDGTKTHFEQIRDRAATALKNAADVLDHAQIYSSRLRQLQEAQSAYEDSLAKTENTYKSELIAIYGYPYSDDIGPSGTYPQGYDGPDLLHYMWTDLSQYGLDDIWDTKTVTVENYKINSFLKVNLILYWGYDFADATASPVEISFEKSASGLIIKPEKIKGTRRAPGEIQMAYSDFIQAYSDVLAALDWYDHRTEELLYEIDSAKLSRTIAQVQFSVLEVVAAFQRVSSGKRHLLNTALCNIEYGLAMREFLGEEAQEMLPENFGAGLTITTDPSAIASAVSSTAEIPTMVTLLGIKNAAKLALVDDIGKGWGDFVASTFSNIGDYSTAITESYRRVREFIDTQKQAGYELECAWGKMIAAQEAFAAVVAKGDRILQARESDRKRAVNNIAKLRYSDMFFRQIRNESLSRYSAAFDLAQKYAYYAAKAYDYETGLLSSDKDAGDSFMSDIIASRSLGELTSDGKPMVSGGNGDPGISDILARMDANWLVLKPRLGINNPQNYATWFSLRHELFRILPGAKGDKVWKTELSKYKKDNLFEVPEFRRLCQQFTAVGGLQNEEPGLVIPFTSTIDFSKNFFGNDLAGEDSAFDSTYYATKIVSAGVYFRGYNSKTNGYTGLASLSKTPVAYLVPVGEDRMRAPGLDDGTVLSYNVIDQTIPLPYSIGGSHLDDPDWTPVYDSNTGGADLVSRIRKHPSFRAYYGNLDPDDSALDCTRLAGRSVWNTKWLLIIPAGSMQSDRDAALSSFINGLDVTRDGITDLNGVSDIEIGFKTYSNSGN